MTTHSPGPWMVDTVTGAIYTSLGGSFDSETELVKRVATIGPTESWEADAHLIAASPELLAALREYHKANRLHHDEDARLYELSLAVIAKADPSGPEAVDLASIKETIDEAEQDR